MGDCYFCGQSTKDMVVFRNGNDYQAWKHLPLKEGAHADCYINRCIEEYMKKQKSKRK